MLNLENTLFHCDCLALLERLPSDSVTLAYLDPPWYPTKADDPAELRNHLQFLSHVVQQVRRTLKNDGSLYFHSVPSLAGLIRPTLDQVFDRQQFQQEYIWPNRPFGGKHQQHDALYLYSKTADFKYYPPTRPIRDEEMGRLYSHTDERGPYRYIDLTTPSNRPELRYEWNGVSLPPGRSWRYNRARLDAMLADDEIYFPANGGVPRAKVYQSEAADLRRDVGTVWSDIPSFTGLERTGYSTQKPMALLNRIIEMGSDIDDLVMDPFCGSGSTLISAQKLRRHWIGCDIDQSAVETTLNRLHALADAAYSFVEQNELLKEYTIVDRTYKRVFTGLEQADDQLNERFIKDQIVPIEETRHYEFKQINGPNVLNSIKSVADEYVVAFLNSEGGRIFWGVTNNRIAVGVPLNSQVRDELRRVLTDKLGEIKPAVDPTQYRIHLHDVYENNSKIPDLYVVEVVVPRLVNARGPYSTGSDQVFVKTDAGKRRLSIPEVLEWARNREVPSPEHG